VDKKDYGKAMDEAVMDGILKQTQENPYPLWRRSHWDEWGSPVGLSIGWALFIIPFGLFLWLLRLAGLIG